MSKDDLSLDVGDVLQLQFLSDENRVRHYVKVIGYYPEKSLIVSAPQVNGKFIMIREGQPAAVRMMSGNDIIAFTVSVLRSCMKPYSYLHLSYPSDMQSVTVRKAQRVAFSTKATVRECGPAVSMAEVPPESIEVKVQDMSTTGALLVAPVALGEVKGLLAMTMLLRVAGADDELNIVAIIRNVREREGKDGQPAEFLHGVEFQFAERSESILLHAFVYEQIATGHSHA